jgi:hypothetical protein
MAFRSEFKDLVLPLAGELHDAWTALVISAVGRVRMIQEPLIEYRQHATNQIGARKLNRVQRLFNATRVPSEHVYRLEKARERLAERDCLSPERQALLDEAIKHFAARAALPDHRSGRLRGIWRELTSGRYRRLSGTSRSALHDLIAA